MRSLAVLVIASALLPGCFVSTEEPVDPYSATTSRVFRGRLVAPDGTWLDGATIELFKHDATGERWILIDKARSAFDGSWWLQAKRAGRYAMRWSARGCVEDSFEFDVEPGIGTQVVDTALEAERTVSISGMLLTSDGLPLSVADVALLFPGAVDHDESATVTGADGATECFPFTGGSALVARYDHHGVPASGEPAATIDPETARFEIVVPGGFEGRVALDFRGREVAAQKWADGDGLVEYYVDVAALRATLGTLELAAESPRSLLVVTRLDAPDGIETWSTWEAMPMPCRLVGIPAGRYAVAFEAGEATVVVAGGVATSATLAKVECGGARVTVRDKRSEALGSAVTDVDLRRCDGQSISTATVSSTISDGLDFVVEMTDVAPGPAVLFVAGGFVRLEIEPGKTAEAELTIVDLNTVRLRARLFRTWSWKLPSSLPARLRLYSKDGCLLSDTRSGLEVDSDGWVEMPLEAPPGNWRFVLDVSDFRTIDEAIFIGSVEGVAHTYPLDEA